MSWKVTKKTKQTLKEPILLVGLPGIGNVGKICVDFIIEELKAKKMFEFFSNTFPNSVFVNEKNLIELPSITMYYKKRKDKSDLLFLTGDVQPSTEKDCYDFCAIVDKLAQDLDVKRIITLGGIGLKEEPVLPKMFITGNNKKEIENFSKKTKIEKKIYGVVGPIMGVSGILPGISKIPSLIFLAETFGHPFYVGINSGKVILEVLNSKFGLKIKVDKLAKEIKEIEEESLNKTRKLKQVFDKEPSVNYIG